MRFARNTGKKRAKHCEKIALYGHEIEMYTIEQDEKSGKQQ